MPLIRQFETQDRIVVFDSDMDPSRSVYDQRLLQEQESNESKHFWFKLRREKICKVFDRTVGKEERILEIGGGTGFIANQLRLNGFAIEMADIHYSGLKYAQQKGVETLYQFDLYNPPFADEFSTICLFDVLEHQKDDLLAIECLKGMLKPHGKLILTVPAHQWLWNRDDKINGHYRRYNRKMMLHLCNSCNLKILCLEYFFTFITPFLLLRTFMNRDHSGAVTSHESLKFELPYGLNSLCTGLTRLEFLTSRWLPNWLGGSLLLIAQKQED